MPKKLTKKERELFERLAVDVEVRPPEGPLMAATRRARPPPGTRLATRGDGAGRDRVARPRGRHPPGAGAAADRLGLIEPSGGTAGAPLFRRQDAALLARAVRLRRDLGLNYAGAVLACELLARIDELERRLRGAAPPTTARGDHMDPNRLTLKTQEALHDAQTKALRYGHTEVDTVHLLLALLEQPDGLVPRLLARADVDTGALRAAVEDALERRPRVSGPGAGGGQLGVTRALGQLLDAAEREAQRLKDEYVSVEHLLLAMLGAGPDSDAGQAAARARRRPRPAPRGPDPGPGRPARHQRHPGVRLRGAREVRARPGRRGARRASSTR